MSWGKKNFFVFFLKVNRKKERKKNCARSKKIPTTRAGSMIAASVIERPQEATRQHSNQPNVTSPLSVYFLALPLSYGPSYEKSGQLDLNQRPRNLRKTEVTDCPSILRDHMQPIFIFLFVWRSIPSLRNECKSPEEETVFNMPFLSGKTRKNWRIQQGGINETAIFRFYPQKAHF